MVQRDHWDTSRGPSRVIYDSRRRGGRGHRAAAPVETCQSLPKRSPWGRLVSKLYTCNRLHRTRRRFQHISANSLNKSAHWTRNSLAMASEPSEGPKNRRMRCRRLPDLRSIPEDVHEPIYPRKKCASWARWRRVPVKNVNYPRAPRNRNSGLVGPHTTPLIVNYEYMASTPREGCFGPTTLGT